MSFALSRAMSTATASYGIYALVRPRHLGDFVTGGGPQAAELDTVAQVFGVRDLAVSLVGLLGRSEKVVTAAMLLRISMDLTDGVVLAARAKDDTVRQQVFGVTVGWATLNALALAIDKKRAAAR